MIGSQTRGSQLDGFAPARDRAKESLANVGSMEAFMNCTDDALMRAEARGELCRNHVKVLVEHVLVRSLRMEGRGEAVDGGSDDEGTRKLRW